MDAAKPAKGGRLGDSSFRAKAASRDPSGHDVELPRTTGGFKPSVLELPESVPRAELPGTSGGFKPSVLELPESVPRAELPGTSEEARRFKERMRTRGRATGNIWGGATARGKDQLHR